MDGADIYSSSRAALSWPLSQSPNRVVIIKRQSTRDIVIPTGVHVNLFGESAPSTSRLVLPPLHLQGMVLITTNSRALVPPTAGSMRY